MTRFAASLRSSSAIALAFAILAGAAPGQGQAQGQEQETTCRRDLRREGEPAAARQRVRDYRPVFQQCRSGAGQTRLAIRRMSVGAEALLLLVDPATLATSLEAERCWACADTDDEAQRDTRYMRAVHAPSAKAVNAAGVVFNAGLAHGAGEGSFITGDLCPSRRPLDRGFFEKLKAFGPQTPVALAISGLWLQRHDADFQWLRKEARSGALAITWINHSFRHPYVPGRPPAQNYLLAAGVDAEPEILDTERLLIANGETPSVFFRFPGLYSNAALIETARRNHLVVLGADGWLVFSPPLRPGAILLAHPNGNEPAGLRIFSRLIESGRLPRPFRPIAEAP